MFFITLILRYLHVYFNLIINTIISDFYVLFITGV